MRLFNDIEDLSKILDETIEKGLSLEKEGKIEQMEEDLIKGLSFNPMDPVIMDPTNDFEYYSPYRWSGDGYVPYPTNYWVSEGKRAEGYRTTDEFYRRFVPVEKALDKLRALGRKVENDIQKAMPTGGLPIGTIHTYSDGQRYKKMGPGQWVPVAGLEHKKTAKWLGHKDPKVRQKASEGIESHAAEVMKIKEIIKQKQAHESTKQDAVREAVAKMQEVHAKLYDGPMPKSVQDHFNQLTEKPVQRHAVKFKGKHQGKPFEKTYEIKGAKHHTDAQAQAQKMLDKEMPGAQIEGSGVNAIKALDKEKLAEKVKRKGKGQGREVDLSKEEVDHLLKSGHYALVSAGRNPNHPIDKDLPDAQIKKRYDRLKDELVHEGYAFSPVKGHYGGEEDSFLVMVHEGDTDHMIKLGKKYNQDSVIASKGGKHEMHFTVGKQAGTHHKGEGLDPKAQEATDYYSEIETSDGQKVKFSLGFDFDKTHENPDIPKGDIGRADNNMGPPPPENKKFQKAGKDVTLADATEFTNHFRKDFHTTGTKLASDIKALGGTYANRIKDPISLTKKMNGRLKERSLNTVTDVIGARALAKSGADQKKIMDHLKKNYDLVEVDDFTDKGRPDGYRAIHLLFKTPSGKIGEMQIKTHRQQAFATYTHDHIYKGDPEIKNDPEVNKFTKDLSDYLYGLDQGQADDKAKRPQEPKKLKDAGLMFDWNSVSEETVSKAENKIKYFAVVRHPDTKENLKIHEFDEKDRAYDFQDNMRKHWKGEVVVGHAHSRHEFEHVFGEYKVNKKGPGSRGGKIVSWTKTGHPVYASQKKGKKK